MRDCQPFWCKFDRQNELSDFAARKGAVSMYQGSNPSAIRSRNEIVNAFLTLLATHDLDDISIKQIMDATDLSR